jgi:uncharacterized protein (DUF488 family)
MLARQNVLLLMLKLARRPVRRVELMNWCFLLRHESESAGGNSFYNFTPCTPGPFSFALAQELEKLQSLSYVLPHGENAWILNSERASAAQGVSGPVSRDVTTIMNQFRGLRSDDLLKTVTQRDPAFLVTRSRAEKAVYTAGYEGLSIDEFLHLLVSNGIERLVDVRSNPTARRYGFHKSTLTRLTGQLGIEYRHFAELGIRSEVRQRFPAGENRDRMFDEYEAATLQTESAAVQDVATLVDERPSVLVCMESEPSCCHRSRLANPVSTLTGLPIIHLRRN